MSPVTQLVGAFQDCGCNDIKFGVGVVNEKVQKLFQVPGLLQLGGGNSRFGGVTMPIDWVERGKATSSLMFDRLILQDYLVSTYM